MPREITDIGWEPGGDVIHITWIDTDHIRVDGAVAVRNTARIDGRSPQFTELVEAIQLRALAALKVALTEWASSEPIELSSDSPVRERTLPDDDESDVDADRNWDAIEANRQAQAVPQPLRGEQVGGEQ